MKTKLGISVSLMAALLYLGGLFGGYIVLTLLVGYVLLKEEDVWLRKSAVKAVGVCLAYSLIGFVIGLLPDVIGILSSFLNIFEVYFTIDFIERIASFLYNILSLLRNVVLLLLAFGALMHKDGQTDPLDKLADKVI